MKRGMVVMTMDAVDVHSVVIEKRSGPMFTSIPSLSENQRKRMHFVLSRHSIIRYIVKQ